MDAKQAKDMEGKGHWGTTSLGGRRKERKQFVQQSMRRGPVEQSRCPDGGSVKVSESGCGAEFWDNCRR